MTTDRPVRAVRVDLAGAEGSAFLARVAALVAASPTGEGVLVESGTDRRAAQLLPAGRRIAEAVAALAATSTGASPLSVPAPAPAPPAPVRAPLLEAPLDLLVPDGAPAPGERAGRGDRSPVVLDTTPTAPGWIGVQSHWMAGAMDGRPGIVAATRYRFAAAGAAIGGASLAAGEAISATLALHGLVGRPLGWRPEGRRARRRWTAGALGRDEFRRARPVPSERAAGLVDLPRPRPFPGPRDLDRHLVLVGATGAGKTTALAALGAARIRAGRPTVVLDVHGDLAPAIAARAGPAVVPTPVAIDAAAPGPPGPGIAGVGRDPDGDGREAAIAVAALKRLSADRDEVYWGARLDRIFHAFVRLAVEEGGTLLDVYDLLTRPERREAARLATRSRPIARFLDELGPIVRRNPEFLWTAAARLGPLALSPRLAGLVAPPPDRAVPLGALLEAGRSVLVRAPIGILGPEGAALAATLVASRVYLELARRPPGGRPVALLLDEAQMIAAPLLTEIVAEGRKFGLRAVLATQYPERLPPGSRQAAGSAVGSHLVFRLPAPAAAGVSEWAGLPPTAGARLLPRLPAGCAIAPPAPGREVPRLVRFPPGPARAGGVTWAAWVDATRRAYGPADEAPEGEEGTSSEEDLLLALLAAPAPVARGVLLDRLAGPSATSRATALAALDALERRGYLAHGPDGVALTAAGTRAAGLRFDHGSTVEGDTHRSLLVVAGTVLARRGERLELLRQGRFDTRLPDGRVALLPASAGRVPADLAAAVDARRRSWAWRYFGGRDAHVEAEVSGAERRPRIERDWEKARAAGAFLLVLVATPAHGRRVAGFLRSLVPDRTRWAVWTLRRAAAGPDRYPPRRGPGAEGA